MNNPLTAHVESVFDIVGKTVDNVTYAPPQHGEGALIAILFTDGTTLTITVPGAFLGAILE